MIQRAIGFVAIAVVTIPLIVIAYFIEDRETLIVVIALIAAFLVLCLLGIARIAVSIFCYAIDTAEFA